MAGERRDTQLYVVSYDIPDDRRRNRIHRLLTGFGQWVQYSVFECHLSKKQLVMLRARLAGELDPNQDRVRVYRLCDPCRAQVETIGCDPPSDPLVYVL